MGHTERKEYRLRVNLTIEGGQYSYSSDRLTVAEEFTIEADGLLHILKILAEIEDYAMKIATRQEGQMK